MTRIAGLDRNTGILLTERDKLSPLNGDGMGEVVPVLKRIEKPEIFQLEEDKED